jgi:hypothetical protein
MTDKQYYINQLAKLNNEQISIVISDESGNKTNRITLSKELLALIKERIKQ